ncbi:hypothetical protein DFH06DRAFT_1293345 [Mycena polygramma]|nr:hypothetical protein DFH06DRAFT_1293345 [Mycena polygramma]
MICEAFTPDSSESEPSLPGHICAFPPELLGRILKMLGYFDILRSSMVCKLWNELVREEPEIAQLRFKRICRSIADNSGTSQLDEFQNSGDPVVIHPALQIMSYSMGENIQTAAIHRPSPHGKKPSQFSIIDLSIAHDFATRPTVTQVFVRPKVDFGDRTGLSGAFCAKATNARGVTVLNVLQAIVRECFVLDSPVLTVPSTTVTDDIVVQALQAAFTPDGKRRGKWLNKADCLEGFRRYEGLEATRDGLRLNAVARLSSQPVEGEFHGPKRD